MRLQQEDTSAFNTLLKSGRFSHAHKVLTEIYTNITHNGSLVNAFDPGSGDKIVLLPPPEAGRFYIIGNVGDENNIEVQSYDGSTINTLAPGETTMVFSGEDSWLGANAPLDLDVFGYTGPGHSEGLVPDPGVGPADPDPAQRRFLSELGWSTVSSVEVGDDYFYGHRGGGVTITPLGAETIEFLSANTSISILAQSGTSPKSMKFTLNAANIDHNALLNYSADQHVAHSSVTLTAGTGISGGGTIAASRSFDFAPDELTIATPVSGEHVVWSAAAGPRRATFSSLTTIIDHNLLLNYVADQHIAHSGVSIVASTGLSGGGNITTSRSLALAIDTLSADTPAVGDYLAFYDVSAGDHNRCALTAINAVLDHDALINFVALEHVDHSAVILNTANGIQGGGDISASRTLSLDNPVDGKWYARKNTSWQITPTITVASTAPSSPTVNDVWIDTT